MTSRRCPCHSPLTSALRSCPATTWLEHCSVLLAVTRSIIGCTTYNSTKKTEVKGIRYSPGFPINRASSALISVQYQFLNLYLMQVTYPISLDIPAQPPRAREPYRQLAVATP